MKNESIVFLISGAFFGLIIGWVLGSLQNPTQPGFRPPQTTTQTSPPPAAAPPQAAALDQARVQELSAVASREPDNASVRVQLGNLYFDAERYSEAITWYEAARVLDPNDVNVSTDLAVCYYYANQVDRALAQFETSLALDPRHLKTLMNLGVVRAFGKQDLAGATAAWQQVVELAPDSPEGQAAKQALDGMRSAHPDIGVPGASTGSGG